MCQGVLGFLFSQGFHVIGELSFGVDPAAGDVDVPVQTFVGRIAIAYQSPLKSFQILLITTLSEDVLIGLFGVES